MKNLKYLFCSVGTIYFLISCVSSEEKSNIPILIIKIKDDYQLSNTSIQRAFFNVDSAYFRKNASFSSNNKKIITDKMLEQSTLMSLLKSYTSNFLLKDAIQNVHNIETKKEVVKRSAPNLYNYFFVSAENKIDDKIKQDLLQVISKIEFVEFVEYYPIVAPISKNNLSSLSAIKTDYSSKITLSDTIIGNNVKLIDVERGWTTRFPSEFDITNPVLGINSISPTDNIHGTSVLGIIKGKRGRNFSGIAPYVNTYLVSINPTYTSENIGVALTQAIDISSGAITSIENGNVLLTELQLQSNIGKKYLPIEYSATFNGILQNAACFNAIIIEPAANGSANLDITKNSIGVLMSTSTSGALIVGSTINITSSTSTYLARLSVSNYGVIVNTFVWGENIYTTQSYSSTRGSVYGFFDNTSASSAIVAGLACYIQSAYKNRFGPTKFITPAQMKLLLYNARRRATYNMPNLNYISTEIDNINRGGSIYSICR